MKPKTLQRVWREIKEANADFFNLRTVISPDPDDDATRFYFIMMPNDGAMAHLTLVGTFYISEGYPETPPIVQLYTPTGRYNVDAYRSYLDREDKRSSTMCFDILRSEAQGGTWKPQYTLSSLFASLMSAIVSFYVAQQFGNDRPEYVSMENLRKVKESVTRTYKRYKDRLPDVPRIPLVEATTVPATCLFSPRKIVAGSPEIITSEPIYLQTESQEVHSFAVDLSSLHPGIVFSVILSNCKTDLLGKKSGTILVRNGVTATAARKLANGTTRWFYHGKPMNDGDMRLHVTIGREQMTFAYYEDGHLYVHGDSPVSRLSADHIGDVRGIPFYVHIYTKDKTAKEPVTIDVLDIGGKGYVHESVSEDERNDFGFELIQSSEAEEIPEHVGKPDAEEHGLDDGMMKEFSGLVLE
ncbi:Ubiquitin-conjugating enzyme E2 6 [Didymosphaeria variabile]|uniref:Ubiquitin-conjugating enzyme E2 6 n=1 Tax=Didymosphaeria variabile TaxID=1932322 RepID=A0A9W8XB84_9PLEO|nr:Ubiquitin-conjugating enzyme E2 6 [Didymosphaeria variabile]KAJ4346479.1 Ubiquitin-conjugating enzyme E2 6 [Didymosphaeria variabile]